MLFLYVGNMNNYDRINTARYLFLTKIFEQEENTLEFELTLCNVEKTERNLLIEDIDLGSYLPISYNESSSVFKVAFDSYIAYSVINESYENIGKTECIGGKIKIYEKSNFLDYVKADTFATDDYHVTFKHYMFITLRHLINIVSSVEPKIEKINP